MTWLRDSNTHLNKSEHDKSKSDQERIVMCSDFSREAVENDVYEIIEWLVFPSELPSLKDALQTQTNSGILQNARAEVHKAVNKIRELKEELNDWITQKGCECGHPACSNCKDTKNARDLLNT